MASFPEVKLAVLFGSTARGQARPKSDVDLGILLEPYSADLRFRVEAELGRAAAREVDVVLLDDAPPLLRFEIAREGILLFQRDDYLWTSFKARAMVDWWDWAPTHRMIAAGVAKRLREQAGHGQPLSCISFLLNSLQRPVPWGSRANSPATAGSHRE